MKDISKNSANLQTHKNHSLRLGLRQDHLPHFALDLQTLIPTVLCNKKNKVEELNGKKKIKQRCRVWKTAATAHASDR